jgi:signal transduction histidine kinase
MIGAMRPTASEASQDVRAQLDRLEEAAARLADGPGRALVVESVRGLREAIERRDESEHDDRHQLGHDLRVPLNAIAGWTHILRLDATTAATVTRAVEVFDRNVRALTRLIERYTSEKREGEAGG